MASQTNITLTIDADLLREARALAAREGTSVSGLPCRRLEELVRSHKAYDAARLGALARLRRGYDFETEA